MHINIIVPFPGAEQRTSIWAEDETKIDFRCNFNRAARCTTAFAAMELKRYLIKTLSDVTISFLDLKPDRGFFISLHVVDNASRADAFSIQPMHDGILISGQGRTGLLYGAYEFLRMQGWRWYAPGKDGEVLSSFKGELVLPGNKLEYKPSMDFGRGFDFESVSMESAELCLWMARNRLNMTGYRPATGPLCSKLGMTFKVGGHIFEKILDPDRVMPSGKTLWEEHEDWYGLPSDGIRKKEKALNTQFCVSRGDLMEFLGEELLRYLAGVWKEADRIDVWGFDTWGSVCNCNDCINLGDSTDQTLFFVSRMRDIINQAFKDGRLDHNVQLVMCCYEGTSTISGPVNPFPQNLIDAGDYGVFYPIRRCYAHDFSDNECTHNKLYDAALKSWFENKPHIPVMIGEYYNVSKFEDLPLLFTTRISRDLPYYCSEGARGMTYMHLPLVNWGMRTVTQVLYAQLAWDINTDTDTFQEEYFTDWYGPYAAEMRKAYELIEEAWLLSSNWRAWGLQSVLTQLQSWDGAKPGSPLHVDDHFKTAEGAVKSGLESVKLMKKALRILNDVCAEEHMRTGDSSGISTSYAVNPIEIRKLENLCKYEMRLGEDRRLLIYGIDTMTVMAELVAYHNALYREDTDKADTAWHMIGQAAGKLDSYFIPISYEWPGAGLESKDGLTRSQVRELLRRCRKYRSGIQTRRWCL